MDVYEIPALTTYSPLEVDHDDRRAFEVAVEWRGSLSRNARKAWAVTWLGKCLSETGEWDHEPIPSSRTVQWIALHRFDREEAIDLAMEACQKIVVNGHHVADLARANRQGSDGS